MKAEMNSIDIFKKMRHLSDYKVKGNQEILKLVELDNDDIKLSYTIHNESTSVQISFDEYNRIIEIINDTYPNHASLLSYFSELPINVQ